MRLSGSRLNGLISNVVDSRRKYNIRIFNNLNQGEKWRKIYDAALGCKIFRYGFFTKLNPNFSVIYQINNPSFLARFARAKNPVRAEKLGFGSSICLIIHFRQFNSKFKYAIFLETWHTTALYPIQQKTILQLHIILLVNGNYYFCTTFSIVM